MKMKLNNEIESNSFTATNKALVLLKQTQAFSKQPQLNDADYKPSGEKKDYQYVVLGLLGLGTGYIVHKYI